MGKEGGGMDKMQGLGGGGKIKGGEGQGWRWGASCSVLSGGTHSWRGVAGDRDRGGGNGVGKVVTRTRNLQILPMCSRKRQEKTNI
jgi:hypothetical protein